LSTISVIFINIVINHAPIPEPVERFHNNIYINNYNSDINNTAHNLEKKEISKQVITNNINYDNNFKSIKSDSDTSLFSILNKSNDSSAYKPDMFLNYFQYKLFDFNGENLEANNTYDNLNKIKLFIDDKEEKSKYLNSPNINLHLEYEEEGKKDENFYGPQRSIFL
jgi:hypothetical protein